MIEIAFLFPKGIEKPSQSKGQHQAFVLEFARLHLAVLAFQPDILLG